MVATASVKHIVEGMSEQLRDLDIKKVSLEVEISSVRLRMRQLLIENCYTSAIAAKMTGSTAQSMIRRLKSGQLDGDLIDGNWYASKTAVDEELRYAVGRAI